jgi:lysophospholipase L1-like esterase
VAVAAVAVAVCLLVVSSAKAWRAPSDFENKVAGILSIKDAQGSREPDIIAAPDGSMLATWSDQFVMKFARAFPGQGPEYHDWTTSDIPGSAVPTGTPNDTSKPAIAVRGDKVAIAYLFNFDRTGSPGQQHDVVLITGRLIPGAPGIAWDQASPIRITTSDTDNTRRVTVAIDGSDNVELAWQDDPDGAPSVIRYLEVGSGRPPAVISTPGATATWPVMAVDAANRLHIVYAENGKVVERFAEPPGFGQARLFGNATLSVGSNAARPDLAILPSPSGGAGIPMVVYEGASSCGKTQTFAAAPGIGPTQLSNCALAGNQTQATIAVRASDRTVYAVWIRETGTAPAGPAEESRLIASDGWRWWSPIEVPQISSSGFFRPQLTVNSFGEMLIAEDLTTLAASGEEVAALSDEQLPSDATGLTATAIPGGGGVRLTWNAAPTTDYQAMRIIRKPTDDFTGPNDPNAVVVGTVYTGLAVVNGHYQVTTPMPTTMDDTTANPNASYVYRAYFSHRGPTPFTNFNQSPGYRFGTSVNYGNPPAPTPAPPIPGPPAFEVGVPQVHNFVANPGDGRVDLSWTLPGSQFDDFKLIRKAGSAPVDPTDGVQLLKSSTATSYADTAVTNGITYYYAIWVDRGTEISLPSRAIGAPNPPNAPFTYISQPTGDYSGTSSQYTLGAVFHVTTPKALLKLGRVYKAGSFSGNKIGIWDAATGALLTSITVSPNSPSAALAQPLVLQANKQYVIGVKEEVGSPWSSSRQLVGLPNYLVIDDSAFGGAGAFAYPDQRDNKPGFSNDDWTMTLGPPDSLALTPPTNLIALTGNARVDLQWQNPADFDNVQLVRKTGSPPANAADGNVVYTGTATSFTDFQVTNGTTYYYGLFSIRRGESSTVGAQTTAKPTLPAGAVTYTTTPTGAYGQAAVNYNAGAVFHVTSDELLLELGRVYPSGSTATNQMGIWDGTTGALLFSTTVTAAAPKVQLATPLLLQAGKKYVVGVKETGPWSGARAVTGLPSFLVIDDSAYGTGTTFAYPNLRDNKPGFSNEDWTMTFGTPGGQPVSSLRAVPSDGRIDVSWSNPADVGVVTVVRKAGSPPATPTDGTIVYTGSGVGFSDVGLTNGTTYHYGAWVQRSGGYSVPARASATPAAASVDPVTGLRANAGDGRVDLFWTNPGPRSVAVIGDSLSTGGSIDKGGVDTFPSSWAGGDDPADGVNSHYERLLAANPALRGNIVNYAHSGSPMSDMLIEVDAAVASGTKFDYITFQAGTNDVCGLTDTPMTDLGDFRSQFRQSLARLNLGLPNAQILVGSIPDWTRLFTLFGTNEAAKTGWFIFSRCPRILANGVSDADRAALRQRIVQLNQILSEECAAATNCRYDQNALFNWQFTPAEISTQDFFHPSRAGQATMADLEWAAGFWPDLANQQVQIVRKVGSAPTGPTDGTVVYTGTSNTFSDTTVTNDTTYYYAAYVTRGGRSSTSALVSTRPSTVVAYTVQPTGDYTMTDVLWNVGTVFHVTQDKVLLELGRAYAPGSTASNKVGLWDAATGVLLASATVDPLNPVAALASPVTLQAGKTYVISVKEAAGSPWTGAPGRVPTGLPPFLAIDDSAYNNSATFSFPALRDNQSAPVRVTEDWTMAFGPPGSAPVVLPNPVSGLQAAPANGKVDLSWTNPTSPFDQILVLRKTGSVPSSSHDGTLVYSGTANSFSDTGLTNGQQYGYGVWVQRAGQLSQALVVLSTPTGLVADPVTGLQASPGDQRVDLSWTKPTSTFDLIKVLRKTGSTPANPSDGTVVYSGTGASVSDTGLTNGTLYYYAVWVQRGQTFSPAVRVAATPDIGPISAVTNLQATAGDSRVDLSWTNPSGTFDRVHVVRKLGSAPASLTDGTEIYSGTAATASDTGLTNGSLYYYAIWVEKKTLLSSPVRVTAVPNVPAPSPVTNLLATPGDRRVDLTWTNPSGVFDTITVVRKAGAAPASPTDGTTVFQGNASSLADAGLTNGTAYYYAVWVQRAGILSPAVRATGVPAGASDIVTYTAAPTGTYQGLAPDYTIGMVFHVTSDKALLALGKVYQAGSTASNQIGIWDEASGVLIYSTTISPTASRVSLTNPLILRAGKKYVLGVKEALGSPWSQQRTMTGLPSFLVIDDTAFIQGKLFTNPTQRDGKPGQANEDWTMTFGTVTSAPNTPDPATNLVATPGDTQVSLAWTNPSSPFDIVEILRKAGSPPSDPSDGTLVYSGTGSSSVLDSAATGVVGTLGPPTNVTLPALSGPAQQGQTMTSDTGTWSNSPTSFDRQWRRCDSTGAGCSDITNATGLGYTLTAADAGFTIRVKVTATNSAGSASAESTQSAVVGAILPPQNLGVPTVTPATTTDGACLQNCTLPGRTLVSDPGTWSRTPTAYERQWTRCDTSGANCIDIPGADGTRYTVTTTDIGFTLRVRVKASNSAGSSSVSSAPTGTIPAPSRPNLVSNPDVESNPNTTFFTNGTGTFTWATDASHSATHSLKLVSNQGNGTFARWMTDVGSIPVIGDHSYGASVWFKTSNLTAYAVLTVTFWNDTTTYSGLAYESTQLTGTQDWTQLSVQAPAPPTARYMRVEMRLWGAGTMWVDDISAIDGTVPPAASVNVTLPAVTGTAQQGQALTGDNGTWNPSSVVYTYQYRRCNTGGSSCVDIPGATNSTYALDAADVGSTVRLRVTATTNRGGAAFVDSAPSATVIAIGVPANLTPPALSGTARQGQALTSDTGTWSGGPTAFVRQWLRCDANGASCAPIAGATDASYTLVAADVGATIRVRVNGNNAAGSTPADSAASALVDAAASTGGSSSPVVSGTPQQGQTLVSDTGSWPGNPLRYSRQWLRCDSAGSNCAGIPGQTAPTYTLTAADVGSTIRVRVTAVFASGVASDVGLTNGTAYYYTIWSFRGGLFSVPVGATATPSNDAPNPVTNLVALPGDGQVVLSWKNPLGTFDTVKVVRKAGAAPADVTDGKLVYNGTGSTATDSGLTNDTTYYYSVWVVRGGKLSAVAQASTTPVASALSGVTNLVASPNDLEVDLTWTNPTSPFDQVMVVRKSGGTPADPTDGTLVYGGTGSAAADTGLTNGATYNYAVWVLRNGQLSAPVTITAVPAPRPLTSVTNLQAVPGNFRVDLSWTNPTFRFDRVDVVRKVGSDPASPTDGTVVYTGTASSVGDVGLTNGTNYRYAVFVERDGAVSPAALVNATPVDPNASVTYTATPTGTYTGTAANYNLGAVFHVTQDKVLLKVGRVYKAGSTAGNQIGIWDGTTGTLLASVNVTPAAPVGTLATPLTLTAGKKYVIGVDEVLGSPWSGGRALTGLPSFLVIDDSAYNTSAAFSYPNLRDNKPGQSNEDWTMTFGAVAAPPVPDPVTGLGATVGDARVDLAWTNPTTAFDQVVVVRKVGSDPAGPTDGTVVYTGTTASYSDTGLTNGTAYHYGVFTQSFGQSSAGRFVTATPAPPPPDPVTALKAQGGDGQVTVTWTNPTTPFDRVDVVRKAGGDPTNTTDGTLVYSGSAGSYTDTGLGDGVNYHYGVWVERGAQLSAPVYANATTNAVVGYTVQPTGDFAHTETAFNIGTVFHVTQDKALLKLGRMYASGSTGANQIGIWDGTTGALLTSTTVDPTAPVVSLATPLALQAGKQYVIGIKESAGSPWSNGRAPTGVPAFLAFDDSAYNTSTSFSYPNLRDNQIAPIKLAEDWRMVFGPPGSPPLVQPDPVTGLVATPADSRVGLAWTNPTTPFSTITVVRRTGSAPTSPSDGTVVYTGTGTSVSDTGLTNGTLYYYGVWVANAAGELSAARTTTSTPTGAVPDPVTGLQATAGDARIDLSWANPTSPFDQVQVVRKAGSAPANPTDGTTVYSGAATSYADTGLTNGTVYYYAVWVLRGGAVSAAARVAAAPALVAISPVSNFQAAPGDGQIALSWSNPSSFDTIHIVRKAGTTPPSTPTDGTVVFDGTGNLFVDTGVTNGTLYQYTAWVVQGGRNSSPVSVGATPSVPAPDPVTGLRAGSGDTRVDLSWTNPSTAFDTIKVLRKAGSPPSGPTDGVTVYTGTGVSTADTGLTNGTLYYYGVWTVRGGVFSVASRVSTIPVAATDRVTYTTQPAGDHAVDNGNYVLGAVFHVTQPQALVSVGRVYSAGSSGANQIGIWDEQTQALVASTTVSPGTPTATLDNAVVLQAGRRYVIGVKETAGSPWSNPRVATGLPSFLVFDDSAYANSSGALVYPNLRDNQAAPIKLADDWSLTFVPAGAAPTAPDSVSGLQAGVSDGRVDLAWTNPTTPFDTITVVRKAGSAPVDPSDGIVVFSGVGTSAADVGLNNGTAYNYAVWTVRAGVLSAPVRTVATPNVTAPSPVTSVVASPGDEQVVVTWQNPVGTFDRVKVVRKAGGAPASPTDGTLVYSGIGTTAVDSGLTNGTLYQYAIWVERGTLLSSAARTSATPVAAPLDPISALQAVPSDLRVDLSWQNPATPFDQIVVVRKAGADPASPTDGTVAYSGTGTTLADTGLTNGVDYHYAVWAQRSGRLSAVTRVNSTPVAPPLQPVSAQQATAGNGQVSLSWTNPSQRFDLISVVRKAGSAPASPTDGAVVYSGTGSSTIDLGLTNGTTYYYAFYVQRDGGFSSVARAQATPLDPGSVVTYTATPTGGYGSTAATYTTGATFHLTDDKVLLTLGRVYKAGSTGTNQIGIWDAATATLLASVTVSPTQPAADLATPLTLQANKQYVIGVKESSTAPWSLARTLTNLPGFLVIDDTAFVASTSFVYPNQRDNKPGQSNEDWTMSFAASGTPAAPAAVTQLKAAWNDARNDLSWTNPAGQFDAVKIVRKAGSAPVDPSDGTVVYNGTGTSTSDTGLTNGTTYHYGVWVVRGGQLSPVARVSSTPNVPVDNVTNLAATPGDLRVDLSWTNPTTRFDRVRVVRKAGSAPADPTDGTQIYSGTASSASDTGLANGTTYHYAIWVERDGLLSFTPTRISVTPVAPPLVTVGGLTATPGNGSVTLTWTNPTIRFDRVVIVRKAGSTPPATEADGTSIYTGSGTTTTDIGLTNGSTYSYGAFVERDGGVSSPATAQATPFDASSVLSYTAQPVGDYGGTTAGFTLGSAFHVNTAKVLLSLGRVYKAGSTGTNRVGIWDAATGTLLGSVTVSPSTPTVDLTTPISLQAGKSYVIGVGETSTAPWSHARVLTGLPGFLVIEDSTFVASAFGYPNGRDNKPGQSNEDWTMRFAASGSASAPNPVTALQAVAGNARVDLSWTNPAGAFDFVQVVRKAGGVPASPSDGTVVYTGTGASVADTGLTNTTTYGYAVWVSNGGQLSTPTTTTATPLAPSVTGLVATGGDLRVDLSWTNPTDAFDSIQIVRKLGATPPTSPLDGTTVFTGTGTSFSDTGLTNGTTYSYGVWVIRAGQLSAQASASGTPGAPALGPVTGLQATAGNGSVTVSWTNPTIRFDRVVVVRKVGADPATAADGVSIYSGTASSVTDTAVTNGLEYHYGVWVQRDTDQSAPAYASAIPTDPAAVVTYTASPVGSYAGSAANFVLGAVFHVTDAKAVTKLGRVYKAGSTAGNKIGIWDATSGALLASVNVTPAAPVATLAVPLQLTAGKQYTIGIQEATGSPWSGSRTLTNLPGFLAIDDTAFLQTTSFAFPNQHDNKPGQSNEDWTISFAPVGAATAPDPVTGFAATAGDGKASFSWTNPTTPFDLVELVRKAGSVPASPSDGTIVYSGTGTSFTDSGAANGTTYGYALWVVRGGQLSTPATATLTPAPPSISNLQATAGDTTVALTWTNPSGAFDQVKITRKAGSPPANPADGTSVYTGTGTSFTDTALTNGTTYHYAVWIQHGTDLSAPVRTSATPDFNNPQPVTNLQTTSGDGSVGLTWTNPTGAFDQILVIRKANTDPTTTSDGVTVYSGTGTSANDTALTNGTPYHYAVWVTRATKLSSPVRATVTPSGGAVPTVTGLSAAPGNGKVDLSWTNPTSRFDLIVVVRKTGSDPANSTDGTTVYSGTASSFSDTGATNGTEYHYGVFVQRDGSFGGGVFATMIPYDPASVVAYVATPTGSYGGSAANFMLGAVFHVGSDQLLTKVGRTYKAGSTAGNKIGIWDATSGALLASVNVTPAAPVATLAVPLQLTAGKQYTIGIQEATGSPWSGSRTLTGLPSFLTIDDTAYLQTTSFAFPNQHDNKPGQSNEDWTMSFAPLGSAPPPPPGPVPSVSNLTATPGNAKVDVSWTNPGSGFDQVVVVRKVGSDPTSKTDGTNVYTGIGASFSDTTASNGVEYHYGVFLTSGTSTGSGVFATAIPLDPASVVTYSAAPTGAYSGTSAGFVLGAVFHVSTGQYLVKVGRAYATGSTAGNKIGIWDASSGSLLASADVTPGSPVATLSSPLLLQANKQYVIGIQEASGSPWSSARALTGLPSFLTIDDTAYIQSASFVYPSQRDSKPGQSNEDWTMGFAPAG